MKERNQGTTPTTSEHALVIIPINGHDEQTPATTLLTLNGKPLLYHAIDLARELAPDIEICVSSNDMKVIRAVNDYGLHVPFKLPQELSTGVLDIDEVTLHAIDHYARKGLNFEKIVMLSPYSPLCRPQHILEAAKLLTEDTEMVASVKDLKGTTSRYYLTENSEGYLNVNKDKSTLNGATLYRYNKAFFILKTSAIRQYPRAFFKKVRKYLMDDEASVFIIDKNDIIKCEKILKAKEAFSLSNEKLSETRRTHEF